MSNPRYPEEFKIEAIKQVTARGLPVAGECLENLGRFKFCTTQFKHTIDLNEHLCLTPI